MTARPLTSPDTSAEHTGPLPLDDVTVVDLSWLLPGQFVGMMLRDLGARVVKIELPGSGDYARAMGPRGYASVNRGKEGLTLDLKRRSSREVLERLVARSDIFLEGFRPGVMTRLGVDYHALSAIQPRLVYCSLSGFGQDGPLRTQAGHGINYGSLAGLQHVAGHSVSLAPIVGDLAGSLFAAIAVLAALRERDRHGGGQYIDLAITDAVYGLMTELLAGDRHDAPSEPAGAFGVFEASDGLCLTLGAVEDHFWRLLCTALDRAEWLENAAWERYEQRRQCGAKIRRALEQVIGTRPRAKWLERLAAAGVPCAPVNDLAAALGDPHAVARRLVTWIEQPDVGAVAQIRFPAVFSTIAPRVGEPGPGVGEHTEAILAELGFDRAEIARLRAAHAV